MEGEWWYSTGATRKGPVSLHALREMYLKGAVTRNSLVWADGMQDWAPLEEVPELTGIVRSLPPELPPITTRDRLASLPPAGPWRRFFARTIDFWVLSLPTGFLVARMLAAYSPGFALWIQSPGSTVAFGWLVAPIVLAVEALVFALFGTTLGKGLLGVKVTTSGAGRVSGLQYLKRQLGVYWYALGTGFPLVSLFTMARQYGHLKAGRPTWYDSGRFSVRAPRLGIVRGLLSVVVIFALLLVNVVLQEISNRQDRQFRTGTSWTNVVTGRTVSVPAGWVHERQRNEDDQVVHVFAGPNDGVYVLFANENVHRSMTLAAYANAWVSAVKGDMTLSVSGPTTTSSGHPALRVIGTLADDPTQRVRATLVRKDDQVWRVLIVGTSGRDPATPNALALESLLFGSIG